MDLNKLFHAVEKEEIRLFAEVNFLKEIKLFAQWSYNSIRTLYMYAKLRNFTRNQPVYHQFESPEHFYIIKEGEFKVTCVGIKRINCSTQVSFKEVYDEEDERVPVDVTLEKFMKKKLTTREVEVDHPWKPVVTIFDQVSNIRPWRILRNRGNCDRYSAN